jgi:hypothetical protein
MRIHLLPAILTLSLAAGGAAFAATKSEGMIKSFDAKSGSLILSDGTTYMLPKGFKDPGLKAGEKVAVTWEMKHKMHEASTVTMVK